MNFFTEIFIKKVQRMIAVIMIVASAMAIVMNVINLKTEPFAFMNLMLLASVTMFALLSLFVYHKMIRLTQIILFFLFGLFAVLLGDRARNAGDVLIIIGTILGYVYGIYNSFYYLPSIVTAFFLFALRIIVGVFIFPLTLFQDSIITSILLCLFLLVIVVIRGELLMYVAELKKNELYVRAGQNIVGVTSLLFPVNIKGAVERLRKKHENQDRAGVDKYLTVLEKAVSHYYELINKILIAAKMNVMEERSPVDIHKVLKVAVDYLTLDINVLVNTDIQYEFWPEPLILNAIPYEILLIFQNILINAIDAVEKTKEKGQIIIKTLVTKKGVNIIISDSGKGFQLDKKRRVVLKVQERGYSLRYIMAIMKHYGGTIRFYNRISGGAEVCISFPIKEVINEEVLF